MSVTEVTDRISHIQLQFKQLSALDARFNPTSASRFSTELETASTALSRSDGSPSGADVVAEAKKYLGLPYVWGGTDPTKGLDCSGLVQLVYKNLGYDLPRVSNQQATAGRPVASMAEAQPGDLIAWDNSSRNKGVDHIAIYIGDGKMIEAPRTGLDVRIVDVPSTPDVIRRILPDQGATGVGSVARTAGTDQVPFGTPYAHLFNTAGAKYGVSPELLSAIARQESGYDPRAVSPAGAQGLMQLMPATARGLGVTDSFNANQAVDGAARLMSDLLDRFGRTDLALAAYNAGPGAVLRHDGIPPYRETQRYVAAIMADLRGER
ncbi:transglycosylase SLT domain-containing protein [Nocardioides sp. Bht2]|uniref:transglycosylase SLT domain-containing protein n=1 Tax=Nocardioides sp. Bht2 TaxID=3392297 RepID=UPI0039B3DC6F